MTTFTSAELAALADQIPTQASQRGLLFVDEAEFNVDADVRLSSDTVTLDTALAIAVQAPFVSLHLHRFNTENLVAKMADEDGDLPSEVEPIISAARFHDGEIEELTVRWPSQGMIFEWVAHADWHEAFWSELISAKTAASLEAHEELKDEWALQTAQMEELRERLATSPEFRFASVKKRKAVAEDIAVKIAGDVIGSSDFRRILKDANALVDRNVLEQERVLKPQIQQLVAELRSYPEWHRANNQIRMREAVVNFLAEKADGYRLGTTFVEQFFQAALGPDHWQMNQ